MNGLGRRERRAESATLRRVSSVVCAACSTCALIVLPPASVLNWPWLRPLVLRLEDKQPWFLGEKGEGKGVIREYVNIFVHEIMRAGQVRSLKLTVGCSQSSLHTNNLPCCCRCCQ